MQHNTIQVGTFEVNCTLLTIDEKTYVVDPGAESERIIALLDRKALTPNAILLTHAHFDHIGGIKGLEARWPNIETFVHPDDVPAFSHPMNEYPPDYPRVPLPSNIKDARTFTAATVIETPGHTPGGVCYYFKESKLLLSGDTLFANSIGRTDLPGGDMETLMKSLKRLTSLPPETTVIPGHGMFTTIEQELENNPFLR